MRDVCWRAEEVVVGMGGRNLRLFVLLRHGTRDDEHFKLDWSFRSPGG